jgi:endonuclease YncB( thermonuclease family)
MLKRILALGAVLLAASVLAAPSSTTGIATVTDGDTLSLRGTKIRLHGVDAPESGQLCLNSSGARYRCGAQSANRLAARITNRTITCQTRDRDRYGRLVAVCRLGSEDLNAWLVSSGLAVAYRQYSRDYAGHEAQAKAAKRGLWAGTFQMPWEYRRSPSALPTAGTARVTPPPVPRPAPSAAEEPYYPNCAAARAAGAAPILRGEPGYRSRLDRDNDGVACE